MAGSVAAIANSVQDGASSKRALEPIERVSEVLFGLIMVLTFTGSFSAAESGRVEVRTMLLAALGCNLAWGLIDAIMYLMHCLSERAQEVRLVAAVQAAKTIEEGQRAVLHAIPSVVASVIAPSELERIQEKLTRHSNRPTRVRLDKQDWRGALAVFLLVVASTIPVVLPFVIVNDPVTALRISNGIAVGLMFIAGYAFGRLAGYPPLIAGGSMVALGSVLVALTIALGG